MNGPARFEGYGATYNSSRDDQSGSSDDRFRRDVICRSDLVKVPPLPPVVGSVNIFVPDDLSAVVNFVVGWTPGE